MPPPQIIILVGAILVALGGFLQYREQLVFEKNTNAQLEDAINSIIGGNSLCFVIFSHVGGGEDGWMSDPAISCKGKYPMYDVTVRVYDPEEYSDLEHRLSLQDIYAKSIILSVGNIGAESAAVTTGTYKVNLEGKTSKRLMADIHARNGSFREEIFFRQIKDGSWKRAIRVYKAFTTDLLHEWAEPEFPRESNGKIIWE